MTNTGILWTLLVLGLHLRLTHAEAGSSERVITKAPAITANPANPSTTIAPSNPANSANPAPPATSANPANPATSANPAPPATSANPAPPATSANPANPTTSANPANPTSSANHANPAPTATSVNPAPLAPTANPALSAHPATATNPASTNSPVTSVADKSQSGKQGEGTSKPSLAQSSQSLATSSPSHAASPSASATSMDKSSQNSATKLSDITDKTAFTNQETSTERIKTTGQSTEGSEKDTKQHHSTSLLPKAETNNSNNTFRVTYILQENMEQNQTDILFKVCMKQFKGPGVINCTLGGTIENNHHVFTLATAGGDLSVTQEIYDKIKEEHKEIPTLIIILASCGGLAAMLLAFAVYCTCHRRSYRKNQQHLTEELQTVENGYHDNPTLEVMEVQPEMQEKKLPLNGEFNDSWMVPLDNLTKEDIADEEDTHL